MAESDGDHTAGGPEVIVPLHTELDILLHYIFTYQLPRFLQLNS
jgi:hypothetical protein